MDLTGGCSKGAIFVTFISTFLYVALFLTFKWLEWLLGVIFLNAAYALFVGCAVAYDRKEKFESKADAQFVTFGTAIAPITVATMDAMFAMADAPEHISIKLAALFMIGTVASGLFMFCLALIALVILQDRFKEKQLRNSSGS